MRLLIFVDWFLPGYKAGGQISSCANIVEALRKHTEIYIITSDRDMNDTEAYPGIAVNTWQQAGQHVSINYVSPGNLNAGNFRKLIKETNPHTIYFNSMFSYRFTLLPLLVLKMTAYENKIVLAPRGMLHPGALQFKPAKKKAVLRILYYSGLLRKVIFHATDETEVRDIKSNIKGVPQVNLVYDFPAMKQESFTVIDKQPGYLKCLFVSRLSEKKNLLYLLRAMAGTKENISLTIAGPAEDRNYWAACLHQIESLPANCSVNYIGPVPNNKLSAIYKDHHLFVLPTFGENFGHVIFDSFINGRPVLISDQTPWRKLQDKKAGFDVSLEDPGTFFSKLEFFAGMDAVALAEWCNNAWLYGKAHIDNAKKLSYAYQSLFS